MKLKQIREKMQEITNRKPTQKQLDELSKVLQKQALYEMTRLDQEMGLIDWSCFDDCCDCDEESDK